MPRIELNLNQADDLRRVKGQWRVGPGLVPGEPNEGLRAQLLNTPARLADYDDSKWEICTNIRKNLSVGFTFAWYRITVELPAEIERRICAVTPDLVRGAAIGCLQRARLGVAVVGPVKDKKEVERWLA